MQAQNARTRNKGGAKLSRDFGSDKTKIIFNEAAIEALGLEQPFGKMVNLGDREMQIIGVSIFRGGYSSWLVGWRW